MNPEEKVGVVYNSEHILHSTTNPNFLETPERLIRIIHYLNKVGAFGESCYLVGEFEPASMDEVLMVHDIEYVRFIKKFCDKGGGFLGDSTYASRETFRVALKAAGGAIKAVNLALEADKTSSFALIRPPGHHALRNKFGGFCILNNAAIAARYLLTKKKLKRIMIVDWDAHSANGTMDIFYDSPDVMLISIHQDPAEIYPREGFAEQIGIGPGKGHTVNVEMPNCSGDEDYGYVMDKIVTPLYEQFNPEFVIGCCGFDAHWTDNSSKLMLTMKGYYDIVNTLRELHGPIAVILEGGYSKSNGKLAHTVIKALLREKADTKEEVSKPNVREQVINKLARLKKNLSEFYKF